MRYLVFLNVDSPTGRMYAEGLNDGISRQGGHPALDCTEVNLDTPDYIYADRDMTRHGGHWQKVHIPHSDVVMVLCYADEESRPVGFLRPQEGVTEPVGAA